jgi:hypothetical protein
MWSVRWAVSEQKMLLDGKLMNVLLSHPVRIVGIMLQ